MLYAKWLMLERLLYINILVLEGGMHISIETLKQSLVGESCTLIPTSFEHADELSNAVQDGELWKLWFTLIPSPNEMESEISRRLMLQEQGKMIPLTVISNKSQKPIGMTSFLNIDRDNSRLEIGGTWYRASFQKSVINTEAKLKMLTYAFEVLNCHAVEFRTHIMNRASRNSIERLGAKFDGVLRNHMVMPNGTLRDTCVYSVISNEWCAVKENLIFLTKKYSSESAQ